MASSVSAFKRDDVLFCIDAETITITKNERIYILTKPSPTELAIIKTMKTNNEITFTTQIKRGYEKDEKHLMMLFEFIDGIQQNITITFNYVGKTENGKRIDKMHKIRENIRDLEAMLKKAKREKTILECEFAGISHKNLL
jgi:hypothetical protein